MSNSTARTIHGVAVDAGSGLEAAIRTARADAATTDDLKTFKRCVLQELGAGASTALVDAGLGPELIAAYPANCEPMLAYEADVYHISDEDRITVLPDNLSPADYAQLGVKQLKFFIYYAPDDELELNIRKQNLVEQVGIDCVKHNLRFLMEPLVYHPGIAAGTAEYAQIKPELVTRATEIFAHERFHADVLKVEVPVDLHFVEGFGEPQRTRTEALKAFQQAAEPARGHELVYLSAGVSFELFEESLKMARETGVEFNGFMCGRALWADAVDIYGSGGEDALRAWLSSTGRSRLEKLKSALL